MKKFTGIILLTLPVFILLSCTASTTGKKNTDTTAGDFAAKNFAVIELFTSQGCSSCPPADRLLGEYAGKENVFALSFHVDYWNRLGWTDPFSSAAFSKRQESYASLLNLSGVYTPQAIVNGKTELVGSDESKMASAVKKGQNEVSSAQVIINGVKAEENTAEITYTLGKQSSCVLNIAVVQNKITTNIRAGENEGVKLTNYNVVRSFKTVTPLSGGKNMAEIDLVKGADKRDLMVILYLQDNDTGKILAAAGSSL